VHPPHQAGPVYGFRCVRCGNGLELPQDVRLLHIDCPYCGQDNLLPHGLVQARQRQFELDQRQYALELQEQDRIRALHEKASARKRSSQRLLIWLSVGAFFGLSLFGGCKTVRLRCSRTWATCVKSAVAAGSSFSPPRIALSRASSR